MGFGRIDRLQISRIAHAHRMGIEGLKLPEPQRSWKAAIEVEQRQQFFDIMRAGKHNLPGREERLEIFLRTLLGVKARGSVQPRIIRR